MYNLQKEKKIPPLVLKYEDQLRTKNNRNNNLLISSFKPGEESIWEKLVSNYYHEEIKFEDIKDYSFREDRILYLKNIKTGRIEGTVYAGYMPEFGRDTGLIKWLAYTEFLSDDGIKELINSAIKKIADDGRSSAVIELLDFHLSDVRCCLDIGFKPLIVHQNQRERWGSVFNALNINPAAFENDIKKEVFNFYIQRKNADNPERTNLRTRWYKNRDHRDVGGSIDTLADEYLYKSSEIGQAEASVKTVKANSNMSLQLIFRCGQKKMPSGSKVFFAMRGQQTLGVGFQCENPETPGYFTVSSHANAQLSTISDQSNVQLGFYIASGELSENDIVTIDVHPFKWTPIADRYEFKVVVNYEDEEFDKRLPNPCVIEVTELKTVRLDATIQMTRKKDQPIHLHVTARDMFDNRTDYNGMITAELFHERYTVEIRNGIASTVIPCQSSAPVQINVICEQFQTKSNTCVTSKDIQAYVGDLHCHDFNSEAWGYPDSVYKWARDEKNLDFLSVSVQSHGFVDNDKWVINKYFAERFLDEGRFVTLLANEWQHSGYGDKIIHFLNGDQPYLCSTDQRYDSAAKLYEAARASDAVIISHHLAYPNGAWCPATTFDDIETDVDRLLEIWSMHGSSEGFDNSDRPLMNHTKENTAMQALKKGLRVGFTAGSDTHSGRPGGSAKEPLGYWGGLVGVWANNLTRKDIFEAIKARRTYALTGARILLRMRVNDAEMGSEISFSENVRIRIDVQAPSRILKVQLIKDAELDSEHPISKNECTLEISEKITRNTFYHCRVILEDGNLAVCSPIWIG